MNCRMTLTRLAPIPFLLLLGLLSGCGVTRPLLQPFGPPAATALPPTMEVAGYSVMEVAGDNEDVAERAANRKDKSVWTVLPEQLFEPEPSALLEQDPEEPTTPGERILEIARQALGSPYRKGGTTPTGFDCSGLVYFAHLKAGIKVPRSSANQHQAAEAVPFDALRPGDLLFFNVKPQRISHVGIFVEDNLFLHAASSGKDVRFSRLDEPYWKKRLVSAGRFGWPTVD